MKTVIVAAITADGFIARDSAHHADWTGKADKKLFVDVTTELGVMVMGARTFATINRALPGRRTIVYTSHPEAITAEGVETTQETPQQLVARLEKEGAHGLAVVGGSTIYGQFMAAGVVDELYISVAPLVFGTGVTLFNTSLQDKLELVACSNLDPGTILLHYKVVRSRS
ncbi:MAG TPA: dihydrofolate reductase family protein [Candidatus Saccharimonadales bacterium]|nr:dihydrofolate reductase family protein [Candidatus Saccharimonadales bacterium]